MADSPTYRQCKFCGCRSLVELATPPIPLCESHLAAFMAGMDEGLESACRTIEKISALSPQIITSQPAHAHA